MNYIDKFKLNKKISLVTGGAGGIGIEICKSLLDAGSKVILADNFFLRLALLVVDFVVDGWPARREKVS